MTTSTKIFTSVLTSMAITILAASICEGGWIYLLVLISHYGMAALSLLFLLLAAAGKIDAHSYWYYFILIFNLWLACFAAALYFYGKVNASLPSLYIANAVGGIAMLIVLLVLRRFSRNT